MYDVVNMPDLVIRYFSSEPWLIVFVSSILYLFLRLNMAGKRAMLGAIAVFFLIINAHIIRIFTALGENSTFYRNLWAIPSIVIIGIAIVDLIRILPRWFLRIPVVAALAILLWFIDNQEYIRCRNQIISTDAKMVPEDVISLSDGFEDLRSQTDKNRIFVVCPIAYGRSYGNLPIELNLYSGFLNISDTSVLNNEDHNGEAELTGENPDVKYIMSTCCAQGMDYVIVVNLENVDKKFRSNGYTPVFKTDGYLVYQCKGYDGYIQDLNAWDQISWMSFYNENGEAVLNEEGYCRVEYQYDKQGKMISKQFKDTEGNLINNEKWLYARCTWKYSKGLLEEERYYDANGKPCLIYSGFYSIMRYTRNEKGQVIKLCYYNEKEELINFDFRNPRATTRYEYDNRGDQISEKYYDTDDKPSVSMAGHDEIRREYDNGHHVIKLGYYCNGTRINRSDNGVSEIVFDYDLTGKVVREAYYDTGGDPVENKDQGYHERIIEYNGQGMIVNEQFFDAQGNQVTKQE